MTLVQRMSLFFLTTLAVVLIGFSTCIYLIDKQYLETKNQESLGEALTVLTAAAEQLVDGVKWDPLERQVGIGLNPGVDDPRWTVRDQDLVLVDYSLNIDTRHPLLDETMLKRLTAEAWEEEFDGVRWAFRSKWIYPGAAKQEWDLQDVRYEKLLLTVAVNLDPTAESLKSLLRTLVGLSVGIWLFAAGVGSWATRRALHPLVDMADASRRIRADDLNGRIPDPITKDELAELATAFNDLLGRVHEAFDRQRRFTSDASHQLRTPLTAIIGQIDVALRSDRPTEEYKRVLTLVRDNSNHLNAIVESLLFLARAGHDTAKPLATALDLEPWLEKQLAKWNEHARATDIRFEGSGQKISVMTHPLLLSQLVDNLIDNALKYSVAGTPITISSRLNGTYGELSVRDRGLGIREQDIPHLFEPFYRGDKNRTSVRVGVGLGLAIAKKIADALKAEIRVESVLNEGSRFTLLLPTNNSPEFAVLGTPAAGAH